MLDVIVQSDILTKALAAAAKVVARKPTIPILANVLITPVPNSNILTVSATDLDLTIVTTIPAAGEREEVTIPTAILFDLARSLPNQSLSLKSKPGAVTLSAGKFKASIQTLPVTDFPQIPTIPADTLTP